MFPCFSALQAITPSENLLRAEEQEENVVLKYRGLVVIFLNLAAQFALKVILMYPSMRFLPLFHFQRQLEWNHHQLGTGEAFLYPLFCLIIFTPSFVAELLYFSSLFYDVE